MQQEKMQSLIAAWWRDSIVPTLLDYIRIPCKSPAFDPQWESAGHIDRAFALVAQWCRERAVPGLKIEEQRLPGRTPLLFMEAPGADDRTVLLYGHLDKQPEMTGWSEGLSPWQPVLRDGRLYGRGGADDGYAAFASVAALGAVAKSGAPRSRVVVLIEGSEESGSPDLPAHLEALADRIGKVDLVICLDSGCGDYQRLWNTTSLRGLVSARLEVEVLREGVHSGGAGGVVPSTFAVARQILDRIEDASTGNILLREFHVEIPAVRSDEAAAAASVLGGSFVASYPFLPGVRALGDDDAERILSRTWRPALEIVGAEGLPALADAGNVLRPRTVLGLSLRLPPTADPVPAISALRLACETDPPHGARVRLHAKDGARGWNAPPTPPWLTRSLDAASRASFGAPVAAMGEGGTIPFMAMLGQAYPDASFVVTGVLGPGSNAHGPNEFLDLETAQRVTEVVAQVIVDHHAEAK